MREIIRCENLEKITGLARRWFDMLLSFYSVCIGFSNWIIFGWLFGKKTNPVLSLSSCDLPRIL